jgi:hypothetical protein
VCKSGFPDPVSGYTKTKDQQDRENDIQQLPEQALLHDNIAIEHA